MGERFANWFPRILYTAVCIAILAILFGDDFYQRFLGPRPPASLDELSLVADRIGLNFYCDPEKSIGRRAILSEHAIDAKLASRLVVGESYDAAWQGTVVVWQADDTLGLPTTTDAGDRVAQWGVLAVYGDPKMIQKIQATWAPLWPKRKRSIPSWD